MRWMLCLGAVVLCLPLRVAAQDVTSGNRVVIGVVEEGPSPGDDIRRQGIIEMINASQVGTFSLEGLPDVELGALLTEEKLSPRGRESTPRTFSRVLFSAPGTRVGGNSGGPRSGPTVHVTATYRVSHAVGPMRHGACLEAGPPQEIVTSGSRMTQLSVPWKEPL